MFILLHSTGVLVMNVKNSPLCVNIQSKQREYFIKAIYLNIKGIILKTGLY